MDSLLIPLTQGQFAIVDADDFDRVSAFKWQATRANHSWYARTRTFIDGRYRTIALSRFIMDAPDGIWVDHKNGNGLDDRKENLRFATPRQNAGNSRLQLNNHSGYKGVLWNAECNQWAAAIAGQYLGLFNSAEIAARAYDTKARERYGEFAYLNFPGEAVEVRPSVHGLWRRNTSGYRHVHFRKSDQRWVARFIVDGKRIERYFRTLEDAVEALEAGLEAS